MNQMELLIFCFCILCCICFLVCNYLFKQETYYKVTHNSLITTLFDSGRYGEYQTFKKLKHYEQSGAKFLFNCYIPKENGETTEIDVLMISKDGIFVLESKNYSGWIFGSENSREWTQVLPQGRGKSRKERFYNPIRQNKGHIKWLHTIVGTQIPLYSIIVFSEHCTLKKVEVTSDDVTVVTRNLLSRGVKNATRGNKISLDEEKIKQLYELLYPFTQVTKEQKEKHVEVILEKYEKEKEQKQNPSISNDTTADRIQLEKESNEPSICPKCGGTMVLRTVKKGDNAGKQFYGCSNFPKCRHRESYIQ